MKTFPNGLFITLEGLEASGKTTLSKRLHEWFIEQGYSCLLVGEPGGTDYGKGARQLFLDHHENMAPEAEVGLLLTAKAQLLQTRVQPALRQGHVVICDRYTDTLFAYQHHAKGHKREMMEKMVTAFNCDLLPDFTLLLRIDPEVSMRRSWMRKNEGGEYSSLDAAPESFHYSVSIGMIQELTRRPTNTWSVINAQLDLDTVFESSIAQIRHRMEDLEELREAQAVCG